MKLVFFIITTFFYLPLPKSLYRSTSFVLITDPTYILTSMYLPQHANIFMVGYFDTKQLLLWLSPHLFCHGHECVMKEPRKLRKLN